MKKTAKKKNPQSREQEYFIIYNSPTAGRLYVAKRPDGGYRFTKSLTDAVSYKTKFGAFALRKKLLDEALLPENCHLAITTPQGLVDEVPFKKPRNMSVKGYGGPMSKKGYDPQMYEKGYNCAAIGFSYIPDFSSAREKASWEVGYKAGMKEREKVKGKKKNPQRTTKAQLEGMVGRLVRAVGMDLGIDYAYGGVRLVNPNTNDEYGPRMTKGELYTAVNMAARVIEDKKWYSRKKGR